MVVSPNKRSPGINRQFFGNKKKMAMTFPYIEQTIGKFEVALLSSLDFSVDGTLCMTSEQANLIKKKLMEHSYTS